jgi:hypothetical protein
LSGERQKLQVFSLRGMASGGAFHRAYLRATQQAFLEAHELAFGYFGGVFRRLRYDNLKAAVKKILRGYQREETARFIAFRSHWGFVAEFCTPAEAHEKGGIEGEAGYFRRNHWVPVPQARDLEDLNRQLLAACEQDQGRTIASREQTIGVAMRAEPCVRKDVMRFCVPAAMTSSRTCLGNGISTSPSPWTYPSSRLPKRNSTPPKRCGPSVTSGQRLTISRMRCCAPRTDTISASLKSVFLDARWSRAVRTQPTGWSDRGMMTLAPAGLVRN